jgi:hypothetical protein
MTTTQPPNVFNLPAICPEFGNNLLDMSHKLNYDVQFCWEVVVAVSKWVGWGTLYAISYVLDTSDGTQPLLAVATIRVDLLGMIKGFHA